MFDFLLKGGPIMWPLTALSILSLAVILERLIFFIKFKVQKDQFQAARFLSIVAQGKLSEAMQMIQTSKDPFLRAAYQSDISSKKTFEISFQHQAKILLSEVQKGISLLDTSITLAPLLGLLGTVIGLINAFSSIGGDQITAPIAITGGISEALLATAYGLAIAIGCLIPFNLLTQLENRTKIDLEEIGSAIEVNLS